ncbi:MAG: triose-phosphate isomerase [Litorivicinus sp.]
MKYFVAGNWKTHLTGSAASELAGQVLSHCDELGVAVFPPSLYAERVGQVLAGSSIGLGLQDISEQGQGATTGDICSEQALDVGCQFVLVGHSERRQRQGETNEWVAQKALAAVQAGLTPVVCVGETLEQRESGQQLAVVNAQLAPVLASLPAQASWMVAYEPVWAIGTGKTASAEQAQAMHNAIRAQLSESNMQSTKILYGGSVKAANAEELAECPDVDGALVGGAALKIDEFAAIVAAFREKK